MIETSRHMHQWRVLNEEMLARLYQAPYGDRAIVLKMRKLGMRLERNETGQPLWLQVAGVLENKA